MRLIAMRRRSLLLVFVYPAPPQAAPIKRVSVPSRRVKGSGKDSERVPTKGWSRWARSRPGPSSCSWDSSCPRSRCLSLSQACGSTSWHRRCSTSLSILAASDAGRVVASTTRRHLCVSGWRARGAGHSDARLCLPLAQSVELAEGSLPHEKLHTGLTHSRTAWIPVARGLPSGRHVWRALPELHAAAHAVCRGATDHRLP